MHGEQFFNAGLVDRYAPVGQAFDHLGVLVDAVDLVADIGEGDGGGEADVAGADDGDFHESGQLQSGLLE